jgi:hypothetical protein
MGKKTVTTFQPGQSGNPAGRPKKTEEIKELEVIARAFTREAIKALASIMMGDVTHEITDKKGRVRRVKLVVPPAARVAAASVLLDRGYGKPLQPVHTEGNNVIYAISDRPPLTPEEWERKYATNGGTVGGLPN